MRRVLSLLFCFTMICVASAAHVGSPDVVFDGVAGPYPVRVTVRPPDVVPGLAEVIVRLDAADARGVSVRPVFWRTGVAGAPKGDELARVPGQDRLYDGQLWLMSRGSYSVYVTVSGSRGSGTAIVPVNAFATGRLPLSRGLGAILGVLCALLVAGLVTIVRAAAGESLMAPGEAPTDAQRRRANRVAVLSVPVLALLLLGGAKWWSSVDHAYDRNMFRPPALDVSVQANADRRTLELSVKDTAAFRALITDITPDHGKMMHLFVIGERGLAPFAHLHPRQTSPSTFTTDLPSLPAGRYRLFGDVVIENGTSLTVTNTVDLPAPPSSTVFSDSDDVIAIDTPVAILARGASVSLGDGYSLAWTGDAEPFVSRQSADLEFSVRDARGRTVSLAPYLGMAGHAVVLRSDASVFIHLHPMGTVSMASQDAFVARDRGDTTRLGHLRADAMHDMADMKMPAARFAGDLSFPYEFPRSGRYRIWVQVKPGPRVLTGIFDVDVR